MEARKFKNGDRVIAGSLKLNLMVVDAVECLTGWRYQLGFEKKDGTLDKRRTHRYFFENNILPSPPKQ